MERIFIAVFFCLITSCAYANPLNIFATQSGTIPLSQLDTNFQNVDCGKYNVNQASADQGVNDSNGSLANIIATVGSSPVTVCLTTAGNYTVTTSITIPATMTLVVKRGAVLYQGGSATLTFNGTLEAGMYQIFSGFSVAQLVFNSGSVEKVQYTWTGGAFGPKSVTSTYTLLNSDSIIDANGTFNISTGTIGTYTVGREFIVKNVGSGTVTLNFTIDGNGGSTGLAQYQSVILYSDGAAWHFVSPVAISYPGAGIPVSTGSAWSSSITETDGYVIYGTGGAWSKSNAPAISAANMTSWPAAVCQSGGTCSNYQATITNPVTGTGIQYYMPVWNSSSALTTLASLGTSGQVLTSNGAGAKPTFQAFPTDSNKVPYTGATGNVNLGTYTLTVGGLIVTNYLAFDNAHNDTVVGYQSGHSLNTGSGNTFVGYQAGYVSTNNNSNVFLGNQAGYNETGSNKLYISNSSTTTPLIGGDFSVPQITINGYIGKTVGGNVTSAATIVPTGMIFHVTGTTQTTLIAIPYTGWTGQITVIPDAAWTTATGGTPAGNNYPLRLATTGVQYKAIIFTFDGSYWYPSY